MNVIFAGGVDWPARVLTRMGNCHRLYSYYYSQKWDPRWMHQLATTGLRDEPKRQARAWGTVSYNKRRTLEVLRRAKAEEQ